MTADWHETETACLDLARDTMAECEKEGCGMPAVLVVDRRDEVRVAVRAAPEVMVDLLGVVVAGLSATSACLACDTWLTNLPEEAAMNFLHSGLSEDLGDLAINHGGLESGLVQECLTLVTADTTGPRSSYSVFYRSQADGTVLWLDKEMRHPNDDIRGRVARWMRAAFDRPTYEQSRGPLDPATRVQADHWLMEALILHFPAEVLIHHGDE